MIDNILFIKLLLANHDRLKELLGDAWVKVRDELMILLSALIDEPDARKLAARTNRIYRILEKTPAESLVSQLFREAGETSEMLTHGVAKRAIILQNAIDLESFGREAGKPSEQRFTLKQRVASDRFPATTNLEKILLELSRPATERKELRQRIDLVRRALMLVGKEYNPPLWATLHYELARCNVWRIQETRDYGIERAIVNYNQALEVFTRQAYPRQWAATKIALAQAYRARIRGKRTQNLEQAISHYEQSLEVSTLQDDAEEMDRHSPMFRERLRLLSEPKEELLVQFDSADLKDAARQLARAIASEPEHTPPDPVPPGERTVTTHPNLSGENNAYVARPYRFSVKLSDQPQSAGGYVSAPPLEVPARDGELMKTIKVHLNAVDFDLDSAEEAQGWEREINFYPEPAASSVVTYTLHAQDRFEERYFSTLRIQFVLDGQVLGYAARRIEVLRDESVTATPPSDFPPAPGYPLDEQGEARVPPIPTPLRMRSDLLDVSRVHLTVQISEIDRGKPLLWEIVSPYLKSTDFPEGDYNSPNLGAEEFVKTYLAPFGMPGDWRYRHMDEHGCLRDQSINNLYGILLNLRRKTPRPFWLLYELALERHRAQGGTAENFTVLFLTSDTHVPWELMPVSEHAEQGGRSRLLGSAHRVGRWLLDVGDPIPETELDLHGFTVAAPTYENKPLPKAQEEREFIEKSGNYKPRILAGFPDAFFRFMATGHPTGGTGILHFAGHGDCCSDLTRCNWLQLSDNQEDSYDVFSADTENANCLGRLRAVVAFFNACNVGRDAPGPLGSNGGWGRALLRQKYKAYVGPLWSVYDEHALEICRIFYSLAVDEGLPLGEVMRRIRARFSEDNRLFTYLAYLYLGHPLAKIVFTPFQGDEVCQKSN